MIDVVEKSKCYGCTACASVCPKKAIAMESDSRGFSYPILNKELCVECGLCLKSCPLYSDVNNQHLKYALAAKHKDLNVLFHSSSGGVFTAVSDYVLKADGIIYGVAFDKNLTVVHTRATTATERDAMRGSKYVQSDIGDIYRLVETDLKKGRVVLFTGTPCQVAGLRGFLRKPYNNLLCCDLICHGVSSPLMFKEQLQLLAQEEGSKVIGYSFRPKRWGWKEHNEIVKFLTGEERFKTPYTDLWRSIYYSRIATRPSCGTCKFCSLERVGDITIGDCRGIEKVLPDFDSFNGMSLVLVNTDKGEEVMGVVSGSLECRKINVQSVIQEPLKHATPISPSSEKFFEDYHKLGYKTTILNRYGKLYPLKYNVKKLLKALRR